MSLFTALRGYFTIRVLRNLIGEKYKKIPSTFIFVLSFLTIIAMPLPWTIELWDISIYRGSLLNNQFHNPTQTANSAFAMGTLLALINTNKQTNKQTWTKLDLALHILYISIFFQTKFPNNSDSRIRYFITNSDQWKKHWLEKISGNLNLLCPPINNGYLMEFWGWFRRRNNIQTILINDE